MTTETPKRTPRVDIATHPRLGQRVSALSYAREALLNNEGGGFMSPGAKRLGAGVEDLLAVANWTLDDTHPYTPDDEDDAEQGLSTYLAIKRPSTWGFAVDETVMNQALTEMVERSSEMTTATRQVLIQLCVKTAEALREEKGAPGRTRR